MSFKMLLRQPTMSIVLQKPSPILRETRDFQSVQYTIVSLSHGIN